jgi:transcriptional regulator with XRE-family HTH domain
LIQQRLKEPGLEQRDLALAAEVTESYVSQLLTRKKLPPAASRTDIYEKMSALLKLPKGKLATLVETQRREELKKKLAERPMPLCQEKHRRPSAMYYYRELQNLRDPLHFQESPMVKRRDA